MRTTLTLDPDVARMIEDEVHRRRQPIKQVINDALRRGLSAPGTRDRPKPYKLVPHAATLRPGFDPAGFNRLADELEDEAVVAKQRKRRSK
jgi:hypothetical protein